MATATLPQQRIWTRVTTTALLLGVAHAVIDLTSGFLIFRDVGHGRYAPSTVIFYVVLYNLLAFAGQAVVGLVADRFRAYRAIAVVGSVLGAAALLVSLRWTPVGVVLVGVGNACFHVGAGAFVLGASGDRATESGVFVGPGAVGLCAGLWLGGGLLPVRGAIVAALLLSVPLIVWATRASRGRSRETELPKVELPSVGVGVLMVGIICALCLVGSVTVRSIVGGTVAGAWRGVSPEVMVALAVTACGGKMLGGFVSDRIGWITSSVGALLVAAPLISLLVGSVAGAVVGMLLFQMTMPVTLKAMHHLMPKRPGLAFGVPCLALVVGALPGLLGYGGMFHSWPLVLGMVAVSAGLIIVGLRMLARMGGSAGPAVELGSRLLGRTGP